MHPRGRGEKVGKRKEKEENKEESFPMHKLGVVIHGVVMRNRSNVHNACPSGTSHLLRSLNTGTCNSNGRQFKNSICDFFF